MLLQRSWKQEVNRFIKLSVYRRFHAHLIFRTPMSDTSCKEFWTSTRIKFKRFSNRDGSSWKLAKHSHYKFSRKRRLMIPGHGTFIGQTKSVSILMGRWIPITVASRRKKTPTRCTPNSCIIRKWPYGAGSLLNSLWDHTFLNKWPLKDLPFVLLTRNGVVMCYKLT